MNVFAAMAVLALLIAVHEAGHFLAATLLGMRVSGFSIGFGPALIKRQRRGVTYAIRMLPLGGFVAFPDEDENSSIPADDPDLKRNRPLSQQALVVSAGILANLLLADAAGLRPGDRILSINDTGLAAGQDGVQSMVRQIKAAPQQTLSLSRERQDSSDVILLRPDEQQGEGRIGAQLQVNLSAASRPVSGPVELIRYTVTEFVQLIQQTVRGFAGLITNFQSTAGQLSGPVKIVEMGAQLSEQGGGGLALFTALISINLAVLNAFPVPLLDGWQMLMLGIEAVAGRPVPERLQLAFAQSGFLLLTGLTLVLIVRDTSQLPAVQQLMAR